MANYDSDSASCCAIGYVRGFASDNYWERTFEADIKAQVENAIREAKADGKSILMATLTTEQTLAEKVLLKMGFKATSENYAYRSRQASSNGRGVKIYTLTLYKKTKY
jgi:hypothetical protein